MGLSEELEKLKFDKRLSEWYVNRGLLTKEELTNYLNSLPDLSENVEPFTLGEENPNQASAQAAVQSEQQDQGAPTQQF